MYPRKWGVYINFKSINNALTYYLKEELGWKYDRMTLERTAEVRDKIGKTVQLYYSFKMQQWFIKSIQ